LAAGVVVPAAPKADVAGPDAPGVALICAPKPPVVVPVDGAPKADGVEGPNAPPAPCCPNALPPNSPPAGVVVAPNAPVEGVEVGCPGVDGLDPVPPSGVD